MDGSVQRLAPGAEPLAAALALVALDEGQPRDAVAQPVELLALGTDVLVIIFFLLPSEARACFAAVVRPLRNLAHRNWTTLDLSENSVALSENAAVRRLEISGAALAFRPCPKMLLLLDKFSKSVRQAQARQARMRSLLLGEEAVYGPLLEKLSKSQGELRSLTLGDHGSESLLLTLLAKHLHLVELDWKSKSGRFGSVTFEI